jgi:hypothetical protein
MNRINVIYRLSDNGYIKQKFSHATKLHCLENIIKEFGIENIYLFIDKVNLKTNIIQSAQSFAYIEEYEAGSSAGSFRYVMSYVLNKSWENEQYVYFAEDDYLYLPNSSNILIEGLEKADYVSLYDHIDKYIPASKGGNPYVDEDGGEITKVFRTKSVHWKLTNSTTMTFATTIRQLHKDKETWDKYTQGTYPHDMQIFIDLRSHGRSLITPIPGYSTHCEPQWASPGIDWSTI